TGVQTCALPILYRLKRSYRVNRALSGHLPPMYLPVSMPKANGEYASKPVPSRCANSARPASNDRLSRLYGFCIETTRGQPFSRDNRKYSIVPQGVSLESPTCLTLPSFTSSSSAPRVSSMGVMDSAEFC